MQQDKLSYKNTSLRPRGGGHKMVVQAAPLPRGSSCVFLPGVNRQQLLDKAKQLEAEAAAAHLCASSLNKQQRYEEAKIKYAEMRRLDAEALQITRQLGCQECMPPGDDADASSSSSSSNGGQKLDEANRTLYEALHVPQPWPDEETQVKGGLTMAARAQASIIACLTCDAAATGVQWIYDMQQLTQLLQQRQQQQQLQAAAAVGDGCGGSTPAAGLEFYNPVQSPFLTDYSSGRNSPYGEQTLLLLQSLAEQRGLDIRAYAELYYDSYMDGFEGYMNASTVAFLRTYGRGMRPPFTGADDAQADCVARLAPLVAMFAGDNRLMQLTAAVTCVTQDSPTAIAWACAGAAVLERLLQGWGAAQAVQDTVVELTQQHKLQQGRMPIDSQVAGQVASQLQRVLELRQMPHADAVEALGRNCHLPNSCQTPLHTLLHQEHLLQHSKQGQQQQQMRADAWQLQTDRNQKVLVAGIRDALAAGGCCASRAGFAGACLGALLGPDAVAACWKQQYEASGRVQEYAHSLCGVRAASE